jgi:hypothetical protein
MKENFLLLLLVSPFIWHKNDPRQDMMNLLGKIIVKLKTMNYQGSLYQQGVGSTTENISKLWV